MTRSAVTDSIMAEWRTVALRDIAGTATGGTPSRKKAEYYGGGIPWVKSGELRDNIINVTEETITEVALKKSNAKLFPPGTLLVALYGATAGRGLGYPDCEV